MIADRQTAEPLLLSIRETAHALSCCQKTVWQLTKDGKLPCVHLTDRAVRYALSDVLAFIESAKGNSP